MENTEKLPCAEELAALWDRAEACVRQGAACEAREAPELAQEQYLQALRLYDRLYRLTGEQRCAAAARELCTGLADLCMQQGNMHGADVYYVLALKYQG